MYKPGFDLGSGSGSRILVNTAQLNYGNEITYLPSSPSFFDFLKKLVGFVSSSFLYSQMELEEERIDMVISRSFADEGSQTNSVFSQLKLHCLNLLELLRKSDSAVSSLSYLLELLRHSDSASLQPFLESVLEY